MPSRAFYSQTADGCLTQKSRDQFRFAQAMPMVDNADGTDNLDMDEWDEWMKWECPAPEMNVMSQINSSMDRQYSSTESSSTNSNQWLSNVGAIQQGGQWQQDHDIKPRIDARFDGMAIDDAPFELDETIVTPDLDLEMRSPGSPIKNDQRRPYRGYSSLTVAEERALQEIAMPQHASPVSESVEEDRESSYSPRTETRTRSKKRKSPTTEEVVVNVGDLCQSKKRGHNAIEKRYRTNLNEKIVLLRQSVPSIRSQGEGDGADEDDDETAPECAEKYGKAAILTRAVEYISHLENSSERLVNETVALKARVAAFEKLAMSGSIQMTSAPTQRIPKTETLESIKADFQQSSQMKADKIKAEPKITKRRNSRK